MNSVLVEFHPFRSEYCALVQDLDLAVGNPVIAKTEDGEDIGRVMELSESDETTGLVVRVATEEDQARAHENEARAREAMNSFRSMVGESNLDLKAVEVHLRHDRRKIAFYFTADQRLDFRKLHKSISQQLNMRVVIKQVGIRDYTRFLGGFGPCGRGLCCSTFLSDLKPITLRMARHQNLYVAPIKITGVCGKLLCCLGFEEEVYQEALESFPKIGNVVKTEQGSGKVIGIDIFNKKLIVRLARDREQYFTLEEVEVEKNA